MDQYLKDYLDLQYFSKKLIRTAAYVRVSHEEQKKHGYSVEAQKNGLQKYANENGYLIVDWYIDEGFSARKKSKTRKELTRLLEDAKQKKFELIIFKCIDRWFRNIAEYHKTQEILEDNKIDWECSEEEYDTTTREGRLKLNLYLLLAQDEADKGSERINYVFEKKIENGEAIFGTFNLPLGLKVSEIEGKKRVVIDESEEQIVNDIFDLYEIHKSKGKVRDLLSEKYDKEITYRNISSLLKNTLYYGAYRDNENYVFGKHYLTKERWLNIQEILKSNVYTTSTPRDYLFSRMCKCEKCGHNMSGQTASRITKRDKKECKWIYYRCNNKYLNRKCNVDKNLEESRIEKALLKYIKPAIEKYIIEYDIKLQNKPKPSININKLRKEQDRLNHLYQKGRIDEAKYDKEYQAIEDKINSANIEEIKPKDFSYLKDILESDIETIYSKLTRAEKAVFWRSFIKSIVFNHETYEILDLQLF